MTKPNPYDPLAKVPTSLRLQERTRSALTELSELTGVSVQDHVRLAVSQYVDKQLTDTREMRQRSDNAAA